MIFIHKLTAVLFLLVCVNSSFTQVLSLSDGIYIENPIYNDSSNHRYSLDNKIYKINRTFLYDYYIIDSLKRKRKIFCDELLESPNSDIGFAEYDFPPNNAIDKVKVLVDDNLNVFLRVDSSYSETVIKYEYLNRAGKVISTEETGVVDNNKNLWIHPPRNGFFKILELDPFPFIYLNDLVREWNWSLQVGPAWSDKRWLSWDGILNFHFNYKRIGSQILLTNFGQLKCEIINGTSTSSVGSTNLKSFYNSIYGFVRLEYTNIEKSKIIFQLVETSDGSVK